jgi:long-chain acyl-CoA synthetase
MNNNTVDAVFENAKTFPEKIALNYKKSLQEKTISFTWTEFEKHIKQVAGALIDHGVNKHDNIAVFSQNSPYWTIADLAIMSINCRTVPIYATSNAGSAEYIINEAEIDFIFVGDEEQYNAVTELISAKGKKFKKIILFNDQVELTHDNAIHYKDFIKVDSISAEVESRKSQIQADDLATIIYTSGTTGEPKGVMLTHGNFLQAFKSHKIKLNCDHTDHSLAFLPLSHVFERSWQLYALHLGMEVTYLLNPKDVIETLAKVKPTVMCSVPRLYQKVYQTIYEKRNESSNLKKKLFDWSVNIAKIKNQLKNNGLKANALLNIKYKIADTLVLKKVRNIFGGRMRLMPCGGAPLSAEIAEFLHAVRLPVVVGYGLTETTATVSLFPEKQINYDSAGQNLPEVEIKIGDNDEILTKGNTMMKGYYKKPKETAEVFEGEWLKTGDAGRFDEYNNLIITDRIKDLMKTAGGKYISPQLIEGLLSNDTFVEQVVVIADDKPFATALLVPNFEALKKYARSLNLSFSNCSELVNLSKVKEFYEEKLETIQKNLAHFERVKKFKLLDKEFSMDENELTPTLKIRRKMIIEKFLHLIDEMYQTSKV